MPAGPRRRVSKAPGLSGGSPSRGKLSDVWLQEEPLGEIHDAGCHAGPVRTPPTASRPFCVGTPGPVLDASPMPTSEVMTWSPSPKAEVTLSRTVVQWMPSEEYHRAADKPVPEA